MFTRIFHTQADERVDSPSCPGLWLWALALGEALKHREENWRTATTRGWRQIDEELEMDEGQNPAPEVGAAKRKLTDNDTFPLRGASRPAQLSETQKCSGESNEGKAESGMGATRNGHTKGDSNTGRTGCSPVQIDATSLDATLASADSSVLNPGEGRSVKGVSQHAEADERVGEEKEICRSPSPDVHGMGIETFCSFAQPTLRAECASC